MSVTARAHVVSMQAKGLRRLTWATASVCVGFAGVVDAQTRDTGEAKSIEEVIVTAQKRSERLEDVPIAISVIGGGELDRSTVPGVSEALTQVPGIKMTQGYQGGGTQLSVRGVSAAAPLFQGSTTVGYYIDGVPFGFVKSAVVPDSNPYDLERIEVLRGPQGTLYGASALNGVVRVLTHDPDLDNFDLKTRTSVSTTEEGGEGYRGDLMLNVPLSPGKFAARAVAGYEDRSGWVDTPVKDDANDAELRSVRLKLMGRPTEALSIGLTGWVSRADYGAPPISDDNDEFPGTLDQPIATDYDVLGLEIGYDASGVSIVSTTSYIDFSNHGNADFSPFGLGILFTGLDSEVLAQEITFHSPDEGAWRWSLGGFYRDAEDRLVQTLGLFPAPIDFSDTSESFAVFGELTRVLADGKFEITGGLRYFEDDVTNIENVRHTGNPSEPLFREKRSFDAVSPRVVLTWHPSDGRTFYGSYSEGFRSGFNQNANIVAAVPTWPAVSEDTLKNYEVGMKGNVDGGRFTYDAAVYYIDWQDVQQPTWIYLGPIPFSAPLNGESASGLGADFAMTVHPVDGLSLGASFSWNDLAMDGPVTAGSVTVFEEGDRLSYSAEYTAGASIDYVFGLGGRGLEGRISAGANYSSAQTARTVQGPAAVINEGDSLLISRASFTVGTDHWTAGVFVDNANNERNSPERFVGIDMYSSRVRPRTTSLQLEYRF
jgi:iron complex outermembrane receptor protein